jgi:hypothetical protein
MDNDDDVHANSLQSLMSLVCFPPIFMKGHLNASFQSFDLEAGAIYKSTSLNPFQYAPQNNRMLVKVATSEMEEAHNRINWKIIDKDRKQILSIIKGVSRVNSMEDVAMTCANMSCVQLAIINVSTTKPLLYQFALKMIKFIENKKKLILDAQQYGCYCASAYGFHSKNPSGFSAPCFFLAEFD